MFKIRSNKKSLNVIFFSSKVWFNSIEKINSLICSKKETIIDYFRAKELVMSIQTRDAPRNYRLTGQFKPALRQSQLRAQFHFGQKPEWGINFIQTTQVKSLNKNVCRTIGRTCVYAYKFIFVIHL